MEPRAINLSLGLNCNHSSLLMPFPSLVGMIIGRRRVRVWLNVRRYGDTIGKTTSHMIQSLR